MKIIIPYKEAIFLSLQIKLYGFTVHNNFPCAGGGNHFQCKIVKILSKIFKNFLLPQY